MANTWSVNFETLYGGQFMLASQLMIPNYLVILFHWHSNTVSSETCPLYTVILLETFFFLCITWLIHVPNRLLTLISNLQQKRHWAVKQGAQQSGFYVEWW